MRSSWAGSDAVKRRVATTARARVGRGAAEVRDVAHAGGREQVAEAHRPLPLHERDRVGEHGVGAGFGWRPQRPRVARPLAGQAETDAVDDLGRRRQDRRVADPEHLEVAVLPVPRPSTRTATASRRPGGPNGPEIVSAAKPRIGSARPTAAATAANWRQPKWNVRSSSRNAATPSPTASARAERGRHEHAFGRGDRGRWVEPAGNHAHANESEREHPRAPGPRQPRAGGDDERQDRRDEQADGARCRRRRCRCRTRGHRRDRAAARGRKPNVAASAPKSVNSHGSKQDRGGGRAGDRDDRHARDGAAPADERQCASAKPAPMTSASSSAGGHAAPATSSNRPTVSDCVHARVASIGSRRRRA